MSVALMVGYGEIWKVRAEPQAAGWIVKFSTPQASIGRIRDVEGHVLINFRLSHRGEGIHGPTFFRGRFREYLAVQTDAVRSFDLGLNRTCLNPRRAAFLCDNPNTPFLYSFTMTTTRSHTRVIALVILVGIGYLNYIHTSRGWLYMVSKLMHML